MARKRSSRLTRRGSAARRGAACRSRRRLGLRGTRRPSWRQRRSTRLWFTRQPSARSRAVMRREPERPKRRASVMSRAIQAGSSAATRAGHRCVLREPPTGPTLRDGHDGSHVHDRLPPGSEVSRGHGLQDGVVQGLVSDQPLEPGVLPLQRLAPLRLIHSQAAVLPPPAVGGLLRHAEPPRPLRHGVALGQGHRHFPQLAVLSDLRAHLRSVASPAEGRGAAHDLSAL